MAIDVADYVAISDLLGRYCWAVDDGDAEGWVAMWTEDGVFTGVTPQPLEGREALKTVPRDEFAMAGGKMRHIVGNLCCDYGASRDEVKARYYNLVTQWMTGGQFTCMGLCDVTLVRHDESWLIRRNDTTLFLG